MTDQNQTAIPIVLYCPKCSFQHIDQEQWATTRKHRTHLCHKCGHLFRPSNHATVGVAKVEGLTWGGVCQGPSCSKCGGTLWNGLAGLPPEEIGFQCAGCGAANIYEQATGRKIEAISDYPSQP